MSSGLVPTAVEKYPEDAKEEESYDKEPEFIQWNYDPNGQIYYPLPKINIKKKLEPGYYYPEMTMKGPRLIKLETKLDGLISFEKGATQEIVDEINLFWESEKKFKEINKTIKVLYKRGILMYGPPGCGKSSMIAMIMHDIVARGGIGLQFTGSGTTTEFIKIIRGIQPNTKILVVLEDIDSFIDNHGEADILNMLDGVDTVLENVLFLGTSNYFSKLSTRLLRPSRFDLKIKLDFPSSVIRKKYLESLFKSNTGAKCPNLKQAVADTEGFSFADLKELFISTCIFGRDYNRCVESLQMAQHSEESRHTSPSDNKMRELGDIIGKHLKKGIASMNKAKK